MLRRMVLPALLLATLVVFGQSRANAYPCQNNPGCLCFDDATYTGGEDCTRCLHCQDCMIIIC